MKELVRCEVCDLDIPKTSFPGHKSGHVRRGEIPKRDYSKLVHQCNECEATFATGSKLWGHRRRIHRDFSEIRTDGCRKRRLIAERGSTCEVCELGEWMQNPMPIEIDHIDGNPQNNVRENLRLICPNCHAQTDTYKGRNIGRNGKTERSKKMKKYYDRKYRG
jgi:hypothetical protein